MKCSCSAWKKNIREIDKYFIYIGLYQNDVGYMGEVFRYCPWCGEKLIDDYEQFSDDIINDGEVIRGPSS